MLEKKLAACVQISGPVSSIYHWEGKIEQSEEWILTVKTLHIKWLELSHLIKLNHPYKTPQITAKPLISEPSFTAWLRETLNS